MDGLQTKTQLISPYAHNSDLGDAWEYMDYPCYPEKASGQAYRMGIKLHDLCDDPLSPGFL